MRSPKAKHFVTLAASLAFSLGSFSAAAQPRTASGSGQGSTQAQVHPQCAKVGNKMGCTCALETGGTITPDGRWRYFNAMSFNDCVSRKGQP